VAVPADDDLAVLAELRGLLINVLEPRNGELSGRVAEPEERLTRVKRLQSGARGHRRPRISDIAPGHRHFRGHRDHAVGRARGRPRTREDPRRAVPGVAGEAGTAAYGRTCRPAPCSCWSRFTSRGTHRLDHRRLTRTPVGWVPPRDGCPRCEGGPLDEQAYLRPGHHRGLTGSTRASSRARHKSPESFSALKGAR
jgi:hypothetical protein